MRILAMIDRQLQNKLRDRAIVLLLFDSGMRRIEPSRLELSNEFDERGRIGSSVIVRPKGDKHRILELDPQTQLALE